METYTKEQIDILKDYVYNNRESLSRDEFETKRNEVFQMMKTYRQTNPHDTRTLKRWEKWYRNRQSVLNPINGIPQRYLDKLQYHLETFRVADVQTALDGLNNWLIKMNQKGYTLNKQTINKINDALRPYGCEY